MRQYMRKTNVSLYYFAVDTALIVASYVAAHAALEASSWVAIIALPLCIWLAAGRFGAIGILMHDAVHYTLHTNKKINDLFGNIGGYMTMLYFPDFRKGHLGHHQHLLTGRDDDAVAMASIASLVPTWRLWFLGPFYLVKFAEQMQQIYKVPKRPAVFFLRLTSVHISTVVLFLLTDWRLVLMHVAVLYFALMFANARAFMEHFYLPPNKRSRTFAHDNFLLNSTVFAHGIGFHELHHRWPGIPWYNLRQASLDPHWLGQADDQVPLSGVFFGRDSLLFAVTHYPCLPSCITEERSGDNLTVLERAKGIVDGYQRKRHNGRPLAGRKMSNASPSSAL